MRWLLRRARCWWKGHITRPYTHLPFGPGGQPYPVGTWCTWCGRTEIFEREWK